MWKCSLEQSFFKNDNLGPNQRNEGKISFRFFCFRSVLLVYVYRIGRVCWFPSSRERWGRNPFLSEPVHFLFFVDFSAGELHSVSSCAASQCCYVCRYTPETPGEEPRKGSYIPRLSRRLLPALTCPVLRRRVFRFRRFVAMSGMAIEAPRTQIAACSSCWISVRNFRHFFFS